LAGKQRSRPECLRHLWLHVSGSGGGGTGEQQHKDHQKGEERVKSCDCWKIADEIGSFGNREIGFRVGYVVVVEMGSFGNSGIWFGQVRDLPLGFGPFKNQAWA